MATPWGRDSGVPCSGPWAAGPPARALPAALLPASLPSVPRSIPIPKPCSCGWVLARKGRWQPHLCSAVPRAPGSPPAHQPPRSGLARGPLPVLFPSCLPWASCAPAGSASTSPGRETVTLLGRNFPAVSPLCDLTLPQLASVCPSSSRGHRAGQPFLHCCQPSSSSFPSQQLLQPRAVRRDVSGWDVLRAGTGQRGAQRGAAVLQAARAGGEGGDGQAAPAALGRARAPARCCGGQQRVPGHT